ncbi:DUF4169 family protein [Azorhizobium doebereinerae]|uniref:DUF4169 family protein n=1 Tax=Azorhizobium doebereinerae TaxID=281091 RepID=UPI00048D09B7|nr:DUF4169 family protein [Azorhizobium doebereinerae]
MGDVVNLNRARKSRARTKAQADAAENRVRFGRTKAEREAQTAQKRLMAQRLDGHARTERED